jgi:hypothetical protein
MVTVTVAITVMVAITIMVTDYHNWAMMTTGFSVVVPVSEAYRYAALFRDHHWPIGRSRSSKRGAGQSEDRGSGET